MVTRPYQAFRLRYHPKHMDGWMDIVKLREIEFYAAMSEGYCTMLSLVACGTFYMRTQVHRTVLIQLTQQPRRHDINSSQERRL